MRVLSEAPLISKFLKKVLALNKSSTSSMMSYGSMHGREGPLNRVLIGRMAMFPTILALVSSSARKVE